jgi:putative heme-binding domain-containing protein
MPCRFEWFAQLVRLTGSAALLLSASVALSADSEKLFTQQPEILPARQGLEENVAPVEVKPAVSDEVFNQGPTAQWIWGADNDQNYALRTTFTGPAKLTRLKAAADNSCTIWINGTKVLSNSDWRTATEVDISKHVVAGENVLQAEVANSGGPAGFALKLALTGADGKTQYVVSDASWKSAAKRDATEFSDVRGIAKLGDKPWGDSFAKSVLEGAVDPTGFFNLQPGFQVERLFTVPKDELGSWVGITFDNKGRLLASDQGDKGLCRITLPAAGSQDPVKVERLDLKVSSAQGMLYAFDALYISVNGGQGSGLYRAKDTNGDDQFDELVQLASFRGAGEHGPHSLRLSPDGQSIYVVCGNHTLPPEKIDASRLPTNWSEDHLLPRQWDANGHAVGILAPGGWIAKTDPEGKTWEIVSMGYRNQYDFAFNADGEMFVYDSDMEWDYGTPWYRPTRVNHATSGSELGWRSGTGVWPTYYLDSLPAMVNIGPGSPVGVTFGYGAKFPAKYQKALLICDWTFGTMYAIHIEPEGASYKAVKEEFISRTPLPLTDNAVGPDGALYFTVGGRGAQSELFRVTYVGKESTAPVDAHDAKFAEQRNLRKQIEQFHQPAIDAVEAVKFVYPQLSNADRFIRYAARIALENQKPELWQNRVLAETNPLILIEGSMALARQGNKALQPQLLEALEKVDFKALPEALQLGYLRALSLVFLRMGEATPETAVKLVAKLDGFFPSQSVNVNRELISMLVYLQSPTVVAKAIKLIEEPSPALTSAEMSDLLSRNKTYGAAVAQTLANAADPQKFHYAFVLRNAKAGWTMDLRKTYFTFLNDCRTKSGGVSFQGFINNLERDAFSNATDAERLAIEAFGLRKPFVAKALPKPVGPGKEYSIEEIVAGAEAKLKGRNFENGQKMFGAARCVVCHRFFGDGGATGPDLSQAAGRFLLKDLTEAIVDPNKVISDQYRGSVVVTDSGKVFTGKIVSESKDDITILVNPEDSTKVEVVKKSEIEETKPATASVMPKDLLKELNEDEVYDLLAYLLSRGDKDHPLFRK